jgi:hypothetical protein
VNRTVAAASLAAAIGLLIAGCSAAPTPSASWGTDVDYTQLSAGTCLAFSYDSTSETATDDFDPDAGSFHAVDCSSKHIGEVVAVVAIPASSEWEKYGSADGPKHDEAVAWLEGVCDSYEVMLAAYSAASTPKAAQVEVSPNYGFLGDNQLGSCIAHHTDSSPLKGGINLKKMAAFASNVSDFGTAVPDSETNWLGASPTPVTTKWFDLKPSACVQVYSGADANEYDAIACDQPHQAQFMLWVPVPSDWDAYQGDTEAAAIVEARCSELQTSFGALDDGTAVVVDSSPIGEDQIVDNQYLAQCWAHRADLGDLTIDLRSLL